ncbi:MAG TPA: MerR family transcriptional regulator [Mobilitalea sp.]|nr:MerR family transcriptional regulator [Mobilitalea sp.]
MEYTVQKLAKLAGISTRTLRYYDEIGLLKPARINSSGYRIYGSKEVDRLQQILFYRELEFPIEKIKEIIDSPEYDEIKALIGHKEQLINKRKQLDKLIQNVEKTLEHKERGIYMTDNEKFEGFKKKLIEENEKKYGKEIRVKYGDETVDASNKKMMNMTKEQYEEFEQLSQMILDTLEEAMKTGDPAGELAQKACELHKKWITLTWDKYSPEAHAGLAQMYVDDERFTGYYDKRKPGMAKFLRDAIFIYTGMGK